MHVTWYTYRHIYSIYMKAEVSAFCIDIIMHAHAVKLVHIYIAIHTLIVTI